MSFSALARDNHYSEEQPNSMNPISKINKGLKKGRPTLRPDKETSESYKQPMTFSSLSKQKPQHSSEVRFKQLNTPNSFSKTSSSKVPPTATLNSKAVQRRLFNDSSSRDDSKQNKMSFTNVIKNSRQKSLKQPYLSHKSPRKIIKPPKAQNGLFNKLKNRLIGGKEEEANAISPLKRHIQQVNPVSRQGELDMVRVSMQSQLNNSVGLDMAPSL